MPFIGSELIGKVITLRSTCPTSCPTLPRQQCLSVLNRARLTAFLLAVIYNFSGTDYSYTKICQRFTAAPR